jgi:hypothetical protein
VQEHEQAKACRVNGRHLGQVENHRARAKFAQHSLTQASQGLAHIDAAGAEQDRNFASAFNYDTKHM